jgi:hypothetical protein
MHGLPDCEDVPRSWLGVLMRQHLRHEKFPEKLPDKA